jgi:large subunit ribosomal protein L3
MPKAKHPRHGSMQFWPHRRAKKEAPVIKKYAPSTEALPLGFAGYKVGMTHVQYTETDKNSPMKGELVNVPVTVIECPPLKIIGIRTYEVKNHAKQPATQAFVDKFPKYLERRVSVPKQQKVTKDNLTAENVVQVSLLVATQPSLTKIGKKTPDVFELGIGGTVEEQLAFAKENLGKEIPVSQVFKPGEVTDIHAVTTGKGFSGAVKRFGIRTRSHKSEKGVRTAGSLGGWKAQAHGMYRVPSPGKHGYYTRITYNQPIVHIGDKPEEINAAGGFVHYGNVQSQFMLIKGSVHGPSKRLIRFAKPMREKKKSGLAVKLRSIFTGSHQG